MCVCVCVSIGLAGLVRTKSEVNGSNKMTGRGIVNGINGWTEEKGGQRRARGCIYTDNMMRGAGRRRVTGDGQTMASQLRHSPPHPGPSIPRLERTSNLSTLPTASVLAVSKHAIDQTDLGTNTMVKFPGILPIRAFEWVGILDSRVPAYLHHPRAGSSAPPFPSSSTCP